MLLKLVPMTHRPSIRAHPVFLAVVLASLLAVVAPASAGAYIYWGSSSGADHRIGRASLDGSEVNEDLLSNGGGNQTPLAVDATHIFYAGPLFDMRANLDGSEAIKLGTPVIEEEEEFPPEGIDGAPAAVDGEHFYWASTTTGYIGRAKLDGSSPEPEFLNVGGAPLAGGIAVYGNYIYWAAFAGGTGETIGRANLTTKVAEYEFIKIPEEKGAPGAPKGIAVDENGIYWTKIEEYDASIPATIGHAGLDGGSATPNYFAGANVTYAGGIAASGGFVYWDSHDENGETIARGSTTTIDNHFIHLSQGYPGWLAVNSATGPPGPPPSPEGASKPPPPPPPKPSNIFTVPKLKLNMNAGAASLSTMVPGPGKLVLSGKGIKGLTKLTKGAGPVTLAVKPSGKTRKVLEKTGRAKVKATLTFTPTGGIPSTRVVKLTLKLG